MTTNRKKKAFTLTELLVVVIVIGVLSAVVLPKFSKVIETRKTTEAEEMMAFVRTEQERRCALDKPYAKELKDILPNTISKNYQYGMIEGQGIKAESKGKYKYTLKMPSYADGRICCENQTECEKLNKNYPLCSDLVVQADYVAAPESCVAEWSGEELPGAPEGPEGCSGSKPDETRSCISGCGFEKKIYTCENGEWSAGAWDTSGCEAQPASKRCDCPGETLPYACNTSSGEWVLSGSCSPEGDCPACRDYAFDMSSKSNSETYCCDSGSAVNIETGEEDDSDMCCDDVYVGCIGPDGSIGNIKLMSEASNLDSYCFSSDGGGADYFCGKPGNSTPSQDAENCKWSEGSKSTETTSINNSQGNVFTLIEKDYHKSGLSATNYKSGEFNVSGFTDWCSTAYDACTRDGATRETDCYVKDCTVEVDNFDDVYSVTCSKIYTSQTCQCE